MRNHLKIFRLWVYISKLTEASEDDDKEEKWAKAQDFTCIAIKIFVEGNVYTDIKQIIRKP